MNSSSTLSRAKTRWYWLGERVLRLDQDADQRVLEELAHGAHHRQAADELGDQPELHQVLGQDVAQDLGVVALGLLAHLGPEADALAADPALDDLVQAGERARRR